MDALLYQLCFTNRTLCLLVSENQIASLVDATLANEVSLFTNLSTRNISVSYTHLRAHETVLDLVCRLLLEKKKQQNTNYDLTTQQSDIIRQLSEQDTSHLHTQ